MDNKERLLFSPLSLYHSRINFIEYLILNEMNITLW